MQQTEKLKRGCVVQLNPETFKNKMLAGCFMTVTEPKSFGAQGYVQTTGENEQMGGQAYYRASFEEMDFIGFAQFIVE
jgi:hypothetical protein